MSHLFSDPAFWYSVSFFLFVAFAAKKGFAVLNGALEAHQKSVQKSYDEAQALYQEAKAEKTAAKKALDNWPTEVKTRTQQNTKKIKELKESFKNSFEQTKDQRMISTRKYLDSKRQEAQDRLEKKIASHVVTELKKSFS